MVFYEGHKVYMNGDYPAIYLNGHSQHIHRLQWIKHFGEIPSGYVVHHIDGNKLNWSIQNLQLLSRNKHCKEHKDVVRRHGIQVVAYKNGITLMFESIEKAALHCHTHPSGIRRIFDGKQKTANGWKFERG